MADLLQAVPSGDQQPASFAGLEKNLPGLIDAVAREHPGKRVELWFMDEARVGQNDRVRRQACFQAVPVRSTALSVTTSLRMQAVSASLAGFPARRSRS